MNIVWGDMSRGGCPTLGHHNQFIDSLTDEEVRLKVRQNHPSSLKEALQCALELESYQLASRQRRGAGAVWEAQLEANSNQITKQKQLAQLQQLQRQRGRVPVAGNIVCWNCR